MSTLIQLLFTFNQDMWVEKTLIQTLSGITSHQLSCNSCSLVWPGHELKKLSYILSVVNSHQLSCNSCSLVWPGHESWKNSHTNSHFKLSSTLMDTNSRLSTLINSHATLVLVWQGHKSWENSHTNSRLSTLINSHATLVLVWPGHKSWKNSHTNSRLSTLINSHVTLVLVWPEKTPQQTLSCQVNGYLDRVNKKNVHFNAFNFDSPRISCFVKRRLNAVTDCFTFW